MLLDRAWGAPDQQLKFGVDNGIVTSNTLRVVRSDALRTIDAELAPGEDDPPGLTITTICTGSGDDGANNYASLALEAVGLLPTTVIPGSEPAGPEPVTRPQNGIPTH